MFSNLQISKVVLRNYVEKTGKRLLTVQSQTTEKTPKKLQMRSGFKISDDIHEYFTKIRQMKLLLTYPERIIRKKSKTPQSFYIAEKRVAQAISKHVIKRVPPNATLIEVNPGPGLLTHYLISSGASNIVLFEELQNFYPKLEEIRARYPERIKVRNQNFVDIWKLAFQDKQDNKSRVDEMLSDIPKEEYSKDLTTWLYGGIGSINFFKHLLNSIIFQNSFLAHCRCEMFLVVPPPIFIHLTCSSDAGYLFYRASTILFQLIFEHEFISKLPRKSFLPWQYEYNLSKEKKLTKLNAIDPEYLYLIRITPRKDLHKWIPVEDLQAFWYFVRQNYISRKNRIIPNLEKWVPGCGPRLITTTTSQIQPHQESMTNKVSLPPLSVPSRDISNQDFYPHMNIFTEFGDLTPMQLLTLFCQFKSWPEYKESPFLSSLETSLLKMETSSEEHSEIMNLGDEDDTEINEKK